MLNKSKRNMEENKTKTRIVLVYPDKKGFIPTFDALEEVLEAAEMKPGKIEAG